MTLAYWLRTRVDTYASRDVQLAVLPLLLPHLFFDIMADDIVVPIPNLDLPQHYFTLSQPKLEHLHKDALTALLEGVEKDGEFERNP